MKDAAGMPDHAGGFKAFSFVGIAYFLTAVLAPLALLVMRGTDWRFPADGSLISLLAGIVAQSAPSPCSWRSARADSRRS